MPYFTLEVALKDRPKVFQIITLSLLSLSIVTSVVCVAVRLQEPNATSAEAKVTAPAKSKSLLHSSAYAAYKN